MITVSRRDVNEVFDFLNLMVFEPEGFKVPLPDHLDILDLDGYLGLVVKATVDENDFIVCMMSNTFESRDELVEIMAHEMIHIYQQSVLGTYGDHDDFFWSFKSIFEKYDIPLREGEC